MITTGNVPDWMIEGRTTLLMKDPTKGSEVSNYRPIACLNFLWKLLTAMISEKTYFHRKAAEKDVKEQISPLN